MYVPFDNRNMLRSLFLSSLIMLLVSCDLLSVTDTQTQLELSDIEMPADFNYSTKQTVQINVRTSSSSGESLPGVKLTFYSQDDLGHSVKHFSGLSDSKGQFSREVTLPASLDELILKNDYIGLPNEITLAIIGGEVSFDYENPAIGNIEASNSQQLAKPVLTYKVGYLGGFDPYSGRPDNLSEVPSEISQDFLNDINASVPERSRLPDSHPEYLADGNEINTTVLQDADVWVTFVHEGAGYKNALGFYTYPSNTPPSSVSDIDSITIIFPNVSYRGSGGDLISGDKAYLGHYPAGTEIGWVLLANAWSSGGINDGVRQLYSNPDFNPENDPSKRQHNVLLYDEARDLTVLGFEDLNREYGSDDDFNDALFFVTSNPRTAIVNGSVAIITYSGDDRDGDGVNDPVDAYPDDPARAFDNYYPAENTFGSLAFEDLWPRKGDYDFNDMVVDYYFTEIMNSANQVVELKADFVLRATGASYENGFGFELGITPETVASVSGSRLSGSTVTLADNGLESGQTQAVCIVFDNAYGVVNRPQGYFVNTQPEAPIVSPDTTRLVIMFSEPVASQALGSPPYNPFIFVDQERIREVHLAGYAPTSLAEGSAYFDSDDDNSSGSGYYKTTNNLPWALDIVETLAYPQEKITIDLAHNFFVTWAENRGLVYSDWFKDKPGYRTTENIY